MTYISVLTEAHAVSSEFVFFPASLALLKAGVVLSGEHLVVSIKQGAVREFVAQNSSILSPYLTRCRRRLTTRPCVLMPVDTKGPGKVVVQCAVTSNQ